MADPTFKQLVRDPRLFLAFGFGSGLSPIVPGTMGTLVAVPLFLLMTELPLWAYLAIIAVTAVWGVRLCGYASRAMGVHDHKGIVWDEFVGFWITMVAVPVNWQTVAAGFVLFRIFDMAKPWPISWVDRNVHGGFGIMVDDVLAGLAAAVVLQLLLAYGIL